MQGREETSKERIEEMERRKSKRGEVQREKDRRYKEICEKKKKEKRERLIRKVGEAKIEGKVWEMINKERRRRKRVNEGITINK